MEKFLGSMFTFIILLAVLIALGLLLAFPIKWTWNETMPYLFNLKEIDWLQAWCLSILGSLLFKGSSTSSTDSK